MKDFYEIIPIKDNIYHIYEKGDVGCTLILGTEKAMLIDTGFGFEDLRPTIDSLTNLPLIVVNTHGHTDHAGGNRYFEQVWMSKDDVFTYEDYQKVQKPLVAARFEGIRKAAGKPPVWPKDFDRMAWYQADTKEFLWLTDGQIFDLGGGHKIEAIHIPGHTVGCVMFFDWKSHILFPGDDLDYSLWMHFNTSAHLSAYKERLKVLKNYPIESMLPAHKKRLLSPWLIDRMDEALSHLSVEKSRRFFHPRTGEPGYLYKESLNGESPDGIDTIFITYQEYKMD